MAYITLFPIGSAMRANFMVYRDMNDPWLREMRHRPTETLFALMPALRKLTGEAEVVGPVKIRPADLYVTHGHVQPGVVLVGDAFATSCPAAGTGTSKVFTDVERLCNVYIPHWFASEGMGADKIAPFYADPVKNACDRHSFDKAFTLRSMSIDQGLRWRARRWARFLGRLAIGMIRRVVAPAPMEVPARDGAPRATAPARSCLSTNDARATQRRKAATRVIAIRVLRARGIDDAIEHELSTVGDAARFMWANFSTNRKGDLAWRHAAMCACMRSALVSEHVYNAIQSLEPVKEDAFSIDFPEPTGGWAAAMGCSSPCEAEIVGWVERKR